MPNVNGKIYYNVVTGDVLLRIPQTSGAWAREATLEQDIASFPVLQAVDKNAISVIRLAWDQYKEEFSVSKPVKVVDGKLQWVPLDKPDEPPTEVLLSDKVKELETEKEGMQRRLSETEDMIIMLTMMY